MHMFMYDAQSDVALYERGLIHESPQIEYSGQTWSRTREMKALSMLSITQTFSLTNFGKSGLSAVVG